MTDDRERWALILGASSGMGEATALALAARGYKIVGVHLDFRAALAHVEEVKAGIAAAGSEALYINMNAADDEKRAAAIETIRARFDESRGAGRQPYLRVVMHSLAFGSLVPFIADDPKDAVDRKKMEMTQDVMGNSLVYWVQDLYHAGFLERGSKIYAMTSEGTDRVVPSYGVVSGAKAALELHIRQLAMEFARRDTGIAVNSISGRRDGHARPAQDPGGRPHDRGHDGSQPARSDDDPAGRCRGHCQPVGDRVRLDQRQHHRSRRRRVRHRLGRCPASSLSARSISISSQPRIDCRRPARP